MTAERLRELHAERYSGASLLVAAAGNVQHEELAAKPGGGHRLTITREMARRAIAGNGG